MALGTAHPGTEAIASSKATAARPGLAARRDRAQDGASAENILVRFINSLWVERTVNQSFGADNIRLFGDLIVIVVFHREFG
jgi:hypothetical protein